MNVLFIQEFIYLQNSRVYRLAEQLKINGCKTFYATLRDYGTCRNKEAFTHGYRIYRDRELSSAKNIIKEGDIDIVIFHNLNNYFIKTNFYTKLIKYCKENNIKFIMSFGDMHSIFDNYFFDSEKLAYINADIVWCLSDIQKSKLFEFFGKRENVHVIPGKIPKTWKVDVEENRRNYDKKDISISYIGRISDVNRNRYIIPVLKRLAKEKIAIDLFLADKPKVEIPKSEYINLIIDLEYKDLIRRISFADFGLVSYSMGEWDKYKDWLELCLPNKFFDYLHANLPIVNYLGQSMKDYIDKYNIGFTYYNLDELIKKIKGVTEEQHNIWRKRITEESYMFKDNEVKELLEGLF